MAFVSSYPFRQVEFDVKPIALALEERRTWVNAWDFTPTLREAEIKSFSIYRHKENFLKLTLFMRQSGFEKMIEYLEFVTRDIKGYSFQCKFLYSAENYFIESTSEASLRLFLKAIEDHNTFSQEAKELLSSAMIKNTKIVDWE